MLPMFDKAAWIVEEGEVLKQSTTLVTHLKKQELIFNNLYSGFESKDEIVNMVEEFLK